jgi:N utilization substance protein A
MFKNLAREIELVGRDKGIKKEVLVEALETALLTAARKVYGNTRDIEAHFNMEMGEIELFEFKTVVETVSDAVLEVTLADARKSDPEIGLGDSLGVKLDATELGRIAAQAAKQVIIQKVRDAEKDIVYNEYIDRKGELVAGIVRRFERKDIIIDLGKTDAILPVNEQVMKEHFRPGDRVQAYVVDVQKTSRKPQIVVSRAHSGLLVKLFENEVPEIYEGIVRIETAAREAGGRSKIAVSSKDSDVDPVGACVGMKGARVQAVVQELRGEKIDIVPFFPDPAKFVCNAISPAEVSRVIIDENNHAMELIVADDQLSLAIGKKGQNVRLAAKLTGWKIDIIGESKMKEAADFAKMRLMRVPGMSEHMSDLLYRQKITGAKELVAMNAAELATVTAIDVAKLEELMASAKSYIESDKEVEDAARDAKAAAEKAEREKARLQAKAEAAAAAAAPVAPVVQVAPTAPVEAVAVNVEADAAASQGEKN